MTPRLTARFPPLSSFGVRNRLTKTQQHIETSTTASGHTLLCAQTFAHACEEMLSPRLGGSRSTTRTAPNAPIVKMRESRWVLFKLQEKSLQLSPRSETYRRAAVNKQTNHRPSNGHLRLLKTEDDTRPIPPRPALQEGSEGVRGSSQTVLLIKTN